jgi:hypothetical protein
MLRRAGAAEGGAGEEERRRDEGTGELAKEAVRAVEGAVLVAMLVPLVRNVGHVTREHRLLKRGAAGKQKQGSHIKCWWHRAN